MIHIALPDGYSDGRHLPFYLAMEEWAARNLPGDDYFFCWQVSPTVIIGRNQDITSEVNLEYCRANSIEVYRRRSGGGCVFADHHNIMMSYITPAEEVTSTFTRYTTMVADMLRSLGLDASATGRNDIMIGDGKVSGNAFYHTAGHSIVHGTMLYDTDFTHMANAITPSRSKLESKKVKSVAAHITTLSRHLRMSLDEFRDYAIRHLTDSEIVISPADIAATEAIEQEYYRPEWIAGRHTASGRHLRRRIEGVGELAIGLTLCDGVIRDISLEGDFFPLGDSDNLLSDRLRGVRPQRDTLTAALSAPGVPLIAGMTPGSLADMIIDCAGINQTE